MTIPSTPESQVKRNYFNASSDTDLLHVKLPASLVQSVRELAKKERRTITAQVTLLLEYSPDLKEYVQSQNTGTANF